MFAGSVDAGERFLVEEASHPIFLRHALKHRHREVLMIGRQIGVFINGSHLVLPRGDFVVAGLYRDSQLVQFVLGLQHAGQNPIRNRAEILIFQFLPLGRLGSERACGRR